MGPQCPGGEMSKHRIWGGPLRLRAQRCTQGKALTLWEPWCGAIAIKGLFSTCTPAGCQQGRKVP